MTRNLLNFARVMDAAAQPVWNNQPNTVSRLDPQTVEIAFTSVPGVSVSANAALTRGHTFMYNGVKVMNQPPREVWNYPMTRNQMEIFLGPLAKDMNPSSP